MGNYNKSLSGIISVLVEKGMDILEVEVGEQNLYYAVKSYEKPSTGTVSSSPYLRVVGWDITDTLFSGATTNAEHVYAQLQALRDKSKAKSQEFSDNHVWRYYSQN